MEQVDLSGPNTLGIDQSAMRGVHTQALANSVSWLGGRKYVMHDGW